MALPTVVKTYQYSVNNTIAAGATDTENFQRVLLGIKNALIGFGTLPWTVVGSSDSAAAAMDAVDRWAAYTNLVWNTAGNARSWIVLKNTGLAANFQLLLCLTAVGATNEYLMEMVISPASGFTGSSTTARPTATDEVVVHTSSQAWIGGFTVPFATVHHVLKSTDGEVTRWIICNNGVMVGYFSIEKAQNPVTGWTVPVVVTSVVSASTTVKHASYANLNYLSTSTTGFLGATSIPLYWTAEGFIAATNGEQINAVVNEISSDWPLGAVGLVSTTIGKRGRHGMLFDVWWIPSGSLITGGTLPSDATRTMAVFGDIVLPWNGTVVQVY